MEMTKWSKIRTPVIVLACAVLFGCVCCIIPFYADGVDELGNKLIDTLTPIFKVLQKVSWVVAAICIVVALINVILSPGGGKGSQTAWMWIKAIIIAVVCINIVTGALSYVQKTVNETGLNSELSELSQY